MRLSRTFYFVTYASSFSMIRFDFMWQTFLVGVVYFSYLIWGLYADPFILFFIYIKDYISTWRVEGLNLRPSFRWSSPFPTPPPHTPHWFAFCSVVHSLVSC